MKVIPVWCEEIDFRCKIFNVDTPSQDHRYTVESSKEINIHLATKNQINASVLHGFEKQEVHGPQ